MSAFTNVLDYDKVEMNTLWKDSTEHEWNMTFLAGYWTILMIIKITFCSYKIRRIEELGKFNNTLLAAVDSKCNIRFVLSVIQGCVLADTIVLFST